VTFRLKKDATYDDRYKRLVNAVHGHTAVAWWSEPTSFWLFASNSSKQQVAAAIKGAISMSTDLALVASMDTTGAVLVGTPDDPATLLKLLPKLQRA
jgi:hypothetical protein